MTNVGLEIGNYIEGTIGQYLGLDLMAIIGLFIAVLLIILIIRR